MAFGFLSERLPDNLDRIEAMKEIVRTFLNSVDAPEPQESAEENKNEKAKSIYRLHSEILSGTFTFMDVYLREKSELDAKVSDMEKQIQESDEFIKQT